MKKNILSKNDLLIISLILKWGGKFKLKTFINEYLFFEKGMLVRVVGVDIIDQFIVLSLDLSEFYNHNLRLMAECYPPNEKTRSLGLGKILYTAIESGEYSDNIDLFFDINEYSTPDEVISYLSEYMLPST